MSYYRAGIGTGAFRIQIFRAVVILVFGLLIARIYQLQFVQGESYLLQADENRFAEVSIPAPRGVIFDRYGTPLAQTRLVNVAALNGDFPLRLAPGSKETSVLWDRMRRLDSQRMPPLGSAVVHQTAADLLGAWIDGQ